MGAKQQDGFERERQQAEKTGYAIERFFTRCVCGEDVRALFEAAVAEVEPLLDQLSARPADISDEDADSEFSYYIGLVMRLLLSALVDADLRDTAEAEQSLPGLAGGHASHLA